jgi:hypothetical protein
MATRGRRPLDPLIKSPLSHIDFAAHFCRLEGKGLISGQYVTNRIPTGNLCHGSTESHVCGPLRRLGRV